MKFSKINSLFVDIMGGDSKKLWERIRATIKIAMIFPNNQIYLAIVGKIPLQLYKKMNKKIRSRKLTNINELYFESYHELFTNFKTRTNCTLVSAGDTRIMVVNSIKYIGKINNHNRPVLAGTFPTAKGLLIYGDLGAIAKNNFNERRCIWTGLLLKELAQAYHDTYLLALQNIGEEEKKGGIDKENQRLLLKEYFGNKFFGNLEMHHLSKFRVNVLIADAVEANNCIKMFAGTQNDMYIKTKKHILSPITKISFKILYALCWQDLDWRKYSGAYLLGVSQPVIVTHGRSDKFAFYHSLKRGLENRTHKIYRNIKENLVIKTF